MGRMVAQSIRRGSPVLVISSLNPTRRVVFYLEFEYGCGSCGCGCCDLTKVVGNTK